MSIGIGQIIIILILALILFGKFPNLFNNIVEGLSNFKKAFNEADDNQEVKKFLPKK